MKLVSYLDSQKRTKIGIRVATPPSNENTGTIIDFQEGFETIKKEGLAPSNVAETAYTDMVSLIANQEQTLPACRAVVSAFNDKKIPDSACFSEAQTEILSPVPRPTSARDAYAFRQHVEAARRNRGVPMIPEFDEFPVFYFTNHLAISGPGPVPVYKEAMDRLDFELEYAAVIGKEGKNIPADRADEYIFGYCIMNDLSARALQMQEMKMSLGPAKGKDFSTTLGPYLVPREELASKVSGKENGERHDLKMRAWVNDKQVSEGNTKDISWTFGQIIERISRGVTIHPGEVIGSGTVGTGCFLELNGSKITDNQWLQYGDKVVLEVDELGRLENTIKKA